MSYQPKCRKCSKLIGGGMMSKGGLCERCERKARGLPEVPKCIHCGKDCTPDEGIVCEACYGKYTPGTLADLDA